MNCRECADFLMQYVSGELPQETSELFARHLAKCRNCDEYLRQYRDTIMAGKRACALEDQTAPSIPEELVRAILAARKT
ncbi:MAG: anti-sigma factor family protein [Vicinamibacterales bacterium]